MPETTVVFGAVAAVVAAPAYVFYIRGIRRGNTVPNLATWVIWSVVGPVIFASYVVTGARDSAMTALVYAVGPPVVLAFLCKRGIVRFDTKDKLFLVASVIGFALWIIFRNSMIALYINIIVDVGAAIPTIMDAWHTPELEDKTTWVFSTVATIINLFAVEHWVNPKLWVYPSTWIQRDFAVCLYPVVVLLMCATIMTLTFMRPDSRIKNLSVASS